jgi:hypothetical protein
LDENGILIINEKAVEDLNIKSEKVVYGFNNEEYNAIDVALGEDFSSFQINEDVQKYKLQFNGRHNIENALAAVIVGSMMDIEETEIAKALNGFKGIKGNSNAASDERKARARKKEIMENAQVIFKIEEKYVENIKRLNPTTTIISSLEAFMNSAEGKTFENTKIINEAFNESPSKGIKVWWEKLTTKQKLTIALVIIMMILGAIVGDK